MSLLNPQDSLQDYLIVLFIALAQICMGVTSRDHFCLLTSSIIRKLSSQLSSCTEVGRWHLDCWSSPRHKITAHQR